MDAELLNGFGPIGTYLHVYPDTIPLRHMLRIEPPVGEASGLMIDSKPSFCCRPAVLLGPDH